MITTGSGPTEAPAKAVSNESRTKPKTQGPHGALPLGPCSSRTQMFMLVTASLVWVRGPKRKIEKRYFKRCVFTKIGRFKQILTSRRKWWFPFFQKLHHLQPSLFWQISPAEAYNSAKEGAQDPGEVEEAERRLTAGHVLRPTVSSEILGLSQGWCAKKNTISELCFWEPWVQVMLKPEPQTMPDFTVWEVFHCLAFQHFELFNELWHALCTKSPTQMRKYCQG